MPESKNKRQRLLGFPKSYAFLVGINNYPKINAHLKSAVNDAKALALVLKHQQDFDYVELLIEDTEDFQERMSTTRLAKLDEGLSGIIVQSSATGVGFRNLLQRIQDPEQEPKINPEDCIVFYYAGHGKPGEFDEGPAGYLLPSDTRPDAGKLSNDSLLPMEDVFETLKILDCHHTLLILDCCFAGKFRQASNSRDTGWISSLPLYEERFMRYKRERAWQVLVSAGPHQTAADWLGERQELEAHVHSPFAEALLEALEGKAELHVIGKQQGDGVLTSQELYLYLWDRVEKLTHSGQLGKNSQYPDLFPMSNHQGGQFIFFDPNNKLNFAKRVLRNPYRGLKSFETNENDLFFGRKTVVKALLTHLLEHPLLVITAPSGSGKSSLVKAGLFPALRAWKNEKEEMPWAEAELFVLRPGERAWTGEIQYPAQREEGKKVIYTGLELLLPRLNQHKKQVLLMDQYEELFTSGIAAAEQTAFENELIKLYSDARALNLKIILTLRSDYEWLLETSTFGQSFWNNRQLTHFLYRLPPMRIDELREAMINPALAELYEFESEKLVETILAEIGNAPGTLPMLSFTMSQFYEITDKDTRVFTQEGYQKLGGINGALSKYADSIYRSLPTDQQGIMQQLFIRMVKVSNGSYSRRRVYGRPVSSFREDRKRNFLNEFDYPDHQDILVEKVLKLLEEKQLLLAGKDHTGEYYEPVHDALLQHWKTARQWISDFGIEQINLQRQLWQAVLDHHKQQTTLYYSTDLTDSLSGSFSKLWDNNTKLLQVLDQVSEAAKPYFLVHQDRILDEALRFLPATEQERFKNTWQEVSSRDEVPNLNTLILSGYSDKLLALFMKKGAHWLNEAEMEFVQKSWEKRIGDILEVKQQRDEALALALNSRAQALPRVEKATALRIAQAAWEKTPHPLPEVKSTLARLFYSQLGTTLQPLPGIDFVGHTDRVFSAVFSPDASLILTASSDDTAKLWNSRGELLASLDGHTDWVKYAVFSPDGSQILTMSDDETLRLWDTTGILLTDFAGHTDWINSAVFSSDGSRILTASKDNTAKLWNIKGKLLVDFVGHVDMVHSAVFSPDGNQVLTASKDHTAKIWTASGKVLTEITGHTGALSSAVFSPDGSQILTASKDNTAKLWNTRGEELTVFKGHTNTINSAVFSPDGSQILTASKDHTAQLWSLTGKVQAHLAGHIAAVNSAVFSPDGNQILTASEDETAQLWSTSGKLLAEFVGHTGPVKSATFSPLGNQILTASDDHTSKCWNPAGEGILSLRGHKDAVKSAVFSPDGNLMLTASNDHTATLWDKKGNHLLDFIAHKNKLNSAVFSPDGSQILTAADDSSAKLWDREGNLLVDFVTGKNVVNSAIFSPDGSQILTVTDDNTVKLWNLRGEEIAALKGHTKWVKSAVFSPDSSQILTASDDYTARLWDTEGALLTEFQGHTNALNSAVFSPDNSQILTASDDHTVKLWHLSGECLVDFKGHTDKVNTAIFSANGRQLLTTSDDKMAKIWDIAGKHLADFVGHTKGVHSAVFSPDGSQILTLSREDNTAKLWNTEGEMLADFVGHTDMINSAVFSPDGSWIITASDDQIAKIWPGPQRIYDYLKKESTITQLTIEQRRAYRID